MELTVKEALIKGVEAHRSGNVQEADRYYTAILQSQPNHPDANHNMGILAVGIGKVEQALPFFEKALQSSPVIEQFWLSYLEALLQLKRGDEARALLEMSTEYNFESESFTLIRQQLDSLPDKGTSIPDVAVGDNQEPSEEELRPAIALYRQGKFQQTLEFISALSVKFPNSEQLLNMLGAANVGLKKHDIALNYYQQAAKINAQNPGTYFNMGVTLQDQGKLDEALLQYEKAVNLKPDYAEAHNNLGVIFRLKGQLEVSSACCKKAIQCNPGYADAYNNFGITLYDKGEFHTAVEQYDKAIELNPEHIDAFFNMGIALRTIQFDEYEQGFSDRVAKLLESTTLVRPSEFVTPVVSLLSANPVILAALEKHAAGELENSMQNILVGLSKVRLLLALMRVFPVPDQKIEALLTALRSSLLLNVTKITPDNDIQPFVSALALQCFVNEYVYTHTATEAEALRVLEKEIERTLEDGEQPDFLSVHCLASYKPLHDCQWCSSLLITEELQDLAEVQLWAPAKEQQLRKEIPVLHQITNSISKIVQEQYEDNPYPRWIHTRLERKPKSISAIVRFLSLRLSDERICAIEKPQVLVAGCGTGENSISAASRFADSEVLAVDLSIRSLAYARRKTDEYGFRNIKYMQADILDLAKLSTRFDVIESMGVLHHMEDPLAGWRVLAGLLKTGGLMKIGLYSELGRRHIVAIRDELSKAGKLTDTSMIRAFRAECMGSTDDIHNRVVSTTDFYSFSAVRDLLFHVQEHRFTISQIASSLADMGLKFCGFELIDTDVMRRFRGMHPAEDDLYSLEKWDCFEKQNPYVFESMYQFWCQKTN